MGEFHDDGRVGYPRSTRIAEVRSQHSEQWPEPLAPGVNEMFGSSGNEVIVTLDGLSKAHFDVGETGCDICVQALVT